MKKKTSTSKRARSGAKDPIVAALTELLSRIPTSKLEANANPQAKAQSIARRAATTAAAISGTLALPPGPVGLATIIPDLIAIWRIQQGMVADIAAVFGKTGELRAETMMYCLFKHGGAALFRDIVTRVGERYLVRRASLRVFQEVLHKIGVRVTQKVIGRSISRFVPLVGALAVGGYAYYDTTQVAATAIELFSADLRIEPPGSGSLKLEAPSPSLPGGTAAHEA